MTHNEIVDLAKQAWKDSGEGWVDTAWFNDRVKALEAFAKLVDAKAFQNGYEKGIAAFNEAVLEEREVCGEAAMKAAEKAVDVAMKMEREACAKVAETSFGVIGSTIAKAIRARGEA